MLKDWKKNVKDMAKRVGKSEAKRQLVVAGVSTSTADKLIRDVYPSEVGPLLGAAIQRAIEASKQQAS